MTQVFMRVSLYIWTITASQRAQPVYEEIQSSGLLVMEIQLIYPLLTGLDNCLHVCALNESPSSLSLNEKHIIVDNE